MEGERRKGREGMEGGRGGGVEARRGWRGEGGGVGRRLKCNKCSLTDDQTDRHKTRLINDKADRLPG